MPPEQRADATSVDSRSDLYAFAGTLLWMLTYRTPLDIQLDGDSTTEQSALSTTLSSILTKATANNPSDRYQSAGELRDALQAGF